MSGSGTQIPDQVSRAAEVVGTAEVVGATDVDGAEEVAEEVPEPCDCDAGWDLSARSQCRCCGVSWATWRRANSHRNN